VLIEDATSAVRDEALVGELPPGMPLLRVLNKIDLVGLAAGEQAGRLHLSARTGEGVEELRLWLLRTAGWRPQGEGVFMARRRHLDALGEAREHLARSASRGHALEVVAEELRLAHRAMGKITGETSVDDLLGEIFSRFCVGK
jgi:tRNA modification GTPase